MVAVFLAFAPPLLCLSILFAKTRVAPALLQYQTKTQGTAPLMLSRFNSQLSAVFVAWELDTFLHTSYNNTRDYYAGRGPDFFSTHPLVSV